MSRLFHARKNMQKRLVDLVEGASADAPPGDHGAAIADAPAVGTRGGRG
jgi:hypothetical protein